MSLEGAQEVGLWVLSGFFVMGAALGCVYYLLGIKRELRPEVPLHEQFATIDQFTNIKEDVDELKKDVKNLDVKVVRKFEEENERASNSRKLMYESIRHLEKDMSSVKKETELQGQRIGQLDMKADTILSRLPRPKTNRTNDDA